jgi:Protein of unknown function (DUF3025)
MSGREGGERSGRQGDRASRVCTELIQPDKEAHFNSLNWDPTFADRCAALFPFAPAARALHACNDWPSLELLQNLCDSRGVVNARGMPLRLVGKSTGEAYEARLYLRGEMHVRSRDWHDLMNVLAWLTYPEIKAAVNARHHQDESHQATAAALRGRRSPVRDALTLFDESGAIVLARDPALLGLIRAFRWKALFWTERARVVEDLRVLVVGHALAVKLLAPYIGLTAHAVLLRADTTLMPPPPDAPLFQEIDGRVAELLRSGPAFDAAQNLSPLPVLGVPGWYPENACEAFYDDAAYFRGGRRPRAPR